MLWRQEDRELAAEEGRRLPDVEEEWAAVAVSGPEEIVFAPVAEKKCHMRGESLVSNTSVPNAALQ
jgi:hypothetical protein